MSTFDGWTPWSHTVSMSGIMAIRTSQGISGQMAIYNSQTKKQKKSGWYHPILTIIYNEVIVGFSIVCPNILGFSSLAHNKSLWVSRNVHWEISYSCTLRSWSTILPNSDQLPSPLKHMMRMIQRIWCFAVIMYTNDITISDEVPWNHHV